MLLGGSVELCSHFGSRPLWKVGADGVRGETGVGAKGLHEVRPLNSSRTTGAARMSDSSWGTRRYCSDVDTWYCRMPFFTYMDSGALGASPGWDPVHIGGVSA